MGGLEERYDRALAGSPGEVVYEKALGGGRIPQGESSRTDPVPGSDLRLTLDRDVQWYLEQLLAARNAEVKAQSASAMVVEVETGRVLAMATVPTYDPSKPVLDAHDVTNRAVEEAYEPGSVQKPVTLAALLDAGAVTPQTVLTVPDAVERADRTIHDSSPHETYRLTMAGVLAKSSNVGTLLATERLPKQDLYRYLERFGYGSRPGLGLLAESTGVLPPADLWTGLDRDTISFGQTLAVSLPQITGAYQAIANGGVRVPLRLVDAVVDADGTEHPLPAAEPVRVVSADAAQQVTTMMEAVTQEGGTASNIEVPGYRIAGKTGTAQKYNKLCGCYRGYTASFMGFAPADDPKVVVTISFQNPSKSRYGGATAGPVWTAITGYTLQKLGVVPSGTPAPQVRLTAG
jgi:cell division protein FtsI (penicillin-binding protein 3)